MAVKTREYTKAEWDALNEKLKHPDEKVICPRCGNEIIYAEIGNSVSVECKTCDCIFGGIRGL